jgi:hypothetical protein
LDGDEEDASSARPEANRVWQLSRSAGASPQIDDAPASFCPMFGQASTDHGHADRRRCAGLASKESMRMSTVRKLVARKAVWLGAALLLTVAACGEQGGEQTEQTPPATTQQ